MSAPASPATGSAATPPPVHFRPGLSLARVASTLGPLADLAGTWIGNGFTLISLPDFDPSFPSLGPKPFRLKLNATIEILEFDQIGADVPNRGSTGQLDISIFGLRYLQRIADVVTGQPLHIEPGLWLNVPATTVPELPATVVRQSTIPHGNSLLALGNPLPLPVPSGPEIDPVDSTPTSTTSSTPLSPAYLAPFDNPTLPPGFKLPYVKNLNLALQDAIQGHKIIQTVVLPISTAAPADGPAIQVGGIVNMPFDVQNANATRLDAIFWIETVQSDDGTFLQLQYTQTVTLNFLGIDWPHISVATLIKQ